MLNMDDSTKHILDFASIFTAVGTVLKWLPYLAAIFTIVWTGIRIYETRTVQTVIAKRKAKKAVATNLSAMRGPRIKK
jgi:hypothetical protein|tara:strand:- start:409 stop:642 length:234 start_codon:yes stop_codon:yes gene_type:complete